MTNKDTDCVISATASNARPSTCVPDRPGAVDVDVTLTIGGMTHSLMNSNAPHAPAVSAPWTLMYTSRTWTNSHGHSSSCTLAQAMNNAARLQLTNLGDGFRAVGLWMLIERQDVR